MLHVESLETLRGHLAARLDQSWINIFFSAQLDAYNPRVRFHLGCAPEGDDGSNTIDFPTDEIPLAEGYARGQGRWTPDFGCPADHPQLRAAYLDTIATW